jgi:hypothetical protein
MALGKIAVLSAAAESGGNFLQVRVYFCSTLFDLVSMETSLLADNGLVR